MSKRAGDYSILLLVVVVVVVVHVGMRVSDQRAQKEDELRIEEEEERAAHF